MQTICVVGTGYVGLTTAVCFADLGNLVTGVEIDLQKLDLLRSGKTPIYEPGLQELLERNMRAGRLSFTDDYAVALDGADLVFITVGTPMGPNGAADLSQVEAAAASIGRHLTRDTIIIDKSTVPVGTGDMVFEIIRAHTRPGVRF
ncbi:MAG: UDP-glucose 6-dehydrogenase, partial [Chloroflexaceae bacterium]